MELRLWTAVGLLVVITVGAVVGVTIISLVLPGGGSAPAPDSGTDAQPPSIDAPAPGLITRVFRYAVAFGLGGFVGLFLGILVGQKAARSQSSEPIPDRYDDFDEAYGEVGDPLTDPSRNPGTDESFTRTDHGEPANQSTGGGTDADDRITSDGSHRPER
jgi:hypothetical protein